MDLRSAATRARVWVRANPWAVAVIAAVVVSFALKIVIALRTYGTNDVLYWERFLATAKSKGGIGLYRAVWYFNHPPFMIHVLRGLDQCAVLTGMPFRLWLKLPAIVADVASVFLLWRILAPKGSTPERPAALLVIALAPTSIMVSGFHGNTDPLVMCFVLLSVYWLVRVPSVLLAGFAMGMALNVKIVPLIFLPAVFLVLPNWRDRARFFGALLATTVVGSLPYLFQDPVFIVQRVFGYESLYGIWGLARLFAAWPSERGAWVSNAFREHGKYLVVAAIVLATLWMRRERKPLVQQLGVAAFLFLSLTPGFGIQYLAWLVPWVGTLGTWPALLYCAASGLFQFLVYDFWAKGFPWYLANSDEVGAWRGHIVYYELLCWAVVLAITQRFMFGAGRQRAAG